MKITEKSILFWILLLSIGVLAGTDIGYSQSDGPVSVESSNLTSGQLTFSASVAAGYDFAIVESREALDADEGTVLVAGALGGAGGMVNISLPEPETTSFLILKLIRGTSMPDARYSGGEYFNFDGVVNPNVIDVSDRGGHVLNRLAYGPSNDDLHDLEDIGLIEWINHQLNPELIPENRYYVLNPIENDLFSLYQPSLDQIIIPRFSEWKYRKGISATPLSWNTLDFDDSDWERGRAGFGYGDRDDNTVFRDMRRTDSNPDGYLTFAIRRKFAVFDPETSGQLLLRVSYDDAFVAYINGVEVARSNVSGARPNYLTEANANHEAGEFEEFDLSEFVRVLNDGVNVLAIQLHNFRITSSDATLIPELLFRQELDVDPVQRISGIDELQQLVHVRGVYAPNQLQTILGEFWENHFTTDFDKVADYFEDQENSDGSEAMSMRQARAEAAHEEFKEYEFFYRNALGRFEDLLMYSATSVPQLIYLDNVTNTKSGPNENYAREILELFAFGVDNRYTQRDIEELSRCFTGWTVRKVWPQDLKPYPASADEPFTETNVQFDETSKIALGNVWRFAKGTLEPTPDQNGNPTTRWARPGFDDSKWLQGRTGIGYADNDDRTVLSDMRRNYASVYLRKSFTLDSPEDLKDLVFATDYDDGYVAYINGVEIARSETMSMAGSPPAYNETASQNHEARGNYETVPVALYADAINFGGEENILAIQVHNVNPNSSDLSILPKLVWRKLREGSIENGDPNGEWAFRFDPDQHDITSKVLFEGKDWQMNIPAGRRGLDGLRDAQDVIRMMANHISTREFISIKLVNRFVSDEISLESFHEGTAPESLISLVHQCMDVWEKTGGSIKAVMEVILDPVNQVSPFWESANFRTKVKTPIEFINSSLRALNGRLSRAALPDYNDAMGMHLFTRDDPDGWSEYGFDWISTATLLERINFSQTLATNSNRNLTWNYLTLLRESGARTAEEIVRYFDTVYFQGTLGEDNIRLLIEYAETDENGDPSPLATGSTDYGPRVRELVGLILSTPHWHYQ